MSVSWEYLIKHDKVNKYCWIVSFIYAIWNYLWKQHFSFFFLGSLNPNSTGLQSNSETLDFAKFWLLSLVNNETSKKAN